MPGACPVLLSAALANAGSMGALGAVLSASEQIGQWMATFRQLSAGPAQINLWLPDPAPERDGDTEAATRAFLANWGRRCRLLPLMWLHLTSMPSSRPCLLPVPPWPGPSWVCFPVSRCSS